MAQGRLIVIAGPTASGKSALALGLARSLDGTVINADSMQVYRDLRILTARPRAEDEAAAPHRLYGVLDAAETCSAARWRHMALAAIEEAIARGRQPIVVGGTGLYLQALVQGLAAVPEIPPAVRSQARALLDELGAEEFHHRLRVRDPEMAMRLRPSDRQRLVRAYEVIEATGVSLARWQTGEAAREQGADGSAVEPLRMPVFSVLVAPPRADLYARIDARLRAMIAAGAVEEVQAILNLGLDPALPVMKALGVRELARHIRGEWPIEQAIAATRQASRRYAKRQMTWFRHRLFCNFIADQSINEQLMERLMTEIFIFIRNSC